MVRFVVTLRPAFRRPSSKRLELAPAPPPFSWPLPPHPHHSNDIPIDLNHSTTLFTRTGQIGREQVQGRETHVLLSGVLHGE